MLLQERNYDLYCDDEIEEETKSNQFAEQRSSTVSVGFSDTSSCANMSTTNSFNNGICRPTFDLSSFNSLATTSSSSSSSSSSCYLSSLTQRSSTLRYRGPPSSSFASSSSGCSFLSEGAATRALLHLATKETTSSTLKEVREEPIAIDRSLNETQEAEDFFSPKTTSPVATATSIEDASTSIAVNSRAVSRHRDDYGSGMQYILEGILLGFLIVPLLHIIATVERYFRSLFMDLQRNAGFLFASLFAPSSFQQEPIDMNGEQPCSSLAKPMHQELVDDEDYSGSPEEETLCCYSSSSSSSDNDGNIESEQDGWGHFADFRDELADESSFIPSCSASPLRTRSAVAAVPPSCVASSTLDTLAEGREEDDDTEEDWSF